jgi:Ca-activated chloride channel family protein
MLMWHLGNARALYGIIPFLLLVLWLRMRWYKPITYRYSLVKTITESAPTASAGYHKKIISFMRFASLVILAFLIAKPQLVDNKSFIKADGIDIVLALDVSGSMQHQDYADDNRSRLAIAKDEAIRFIQKRTNDAIGLVLFANETLSRCPVTHDKKMIRDMVKDIELGMINPDGTLLATAIVTACNRLKHSESTSKVIVLLTDGQPSDKDMNPTVALEVAQKLGIKIYTIGIGSDKDEVIMHSFFGPIGRPKINKELLTYFAQKTGGTFFHARNAGDMRAIYDTIDQLEKKEYQAPVYQKYYDIFMPFAWLVLALFGAELFASTLIWYGL